MLVDEGDPYSALLVNKSINKLKARGIFGKIEKKIREGSSPELKVLEVTVEEKPTGEMMAGAGVGTDGTSFMFSVSENNWLGRGVMFKSSLNLTTETISGGVSIQNPNYNFTGNSVFSSLFISTADRTESSGFKSAKSSFNLGTEFEIYEGVYFSPSFGVAYEDIEVQSSASASMQKMEGTFTNADFDYGIVVDKRNQTFKPTDGYRARFVQSLPLIQDSSSILNGLDLSVYRAISDDVIGSVKFYGRAIHGVDEDVRLTDRLKMPANKLRGFDTRKIGPKDGEGQAEAGEIVAMGLIIDSLQTSSG